MVRYFQVAGLCFSLDLPDNHPSADLLHNYDPFELGDSGSPAGMTKESVGHDPESLLFSLSVVPDPPAERGEDFYRAPEESGQPVIGLLRTSDGWQAEFSPMPGIPCCGILILDEATSALDAETEELLLERLSSRYKGTRTLIFISHRDAVTTRADRILRVG